MRRAVDRYVEHLLRRRRPPAFAPNEDDVAITRTAIDLMGASPDADGPSEAFIDDLSRRLEEHDPAPAPRPGTRRRPFLQAAALTAAVGVGWAADDLINSQTSSVAPTSDGAGAEITPTRGIWQAVTASADLPEGAVVSFDLGSIAGFLRRDAGGVQAVSGICTHQGCRLDLAPARDAFACPCHNATFSLTGQSLTHPRSTAALPPLPALATREQDGSIQVYVPGPPVTTPE